MFINKNRQTSSDKTLFPLSDQDLLALFGGSGTGPAKDWRPPVQPIAPPVISAPMPGPIVNFNRRDQSLTMGMGFQAGPVFGGVQATQSTSIHGPRGLEGKVSLGVKWGKK